MLCGSKQLLRELFEASEIFVIPGLRPKIRSIAEILSGQSRSFRDQIFEVVGSRKAAGIRKRIAQFRLVLGGNRQIRAIEVSQVTLK